MAFQTDGSSHKNGVLSESTLVKYKDQLESFYSKNIIDFIHKGGTHTKTDNIIQFEDETYQLLSVKSKKNLNKGSFDWCNLSNFDKSFIQNTLKFVDDNRCSGNLECRNMLDDIIYSELINLDDKTITDLFLNEVIRKYDDLDLIVEDRANDILYKKEPVIFKMIEDGWKLTLHKKMRGKGSCKINCISPNGEIKDMGLRIRLHLNNGKTMWLDKEDGKSYVCLKFQQDKIKKFLNDSF